MPAVRPSILAHLDASQLDLRQAAQALAQAERLRAELFEMRSRHSMDRDRARERVLMQEMYGQADLARRFLEEVLERHEGEVAK